MGQARRNAGAVGEDYRRGRKDNPRTGRAKDGRYGAGHGAGQVLGELGGNPARRSPAGQGAADCSAHSAGPGPWKHKAVIFLLYEMFRMAG